MSDNLVPPGDLLLRSRLVRLLLRLHLPVKKPGYGPEAYIREIKIHVYRIRQTANVSGEFLRIETEQLKKVQNDSCGQN